MIFALAKVRIQLVCERDFKQTTEARNGVEFWAIGRQRHEPKISGQPRVFDCQEEVGLFLYDPVVASAHL